MYYSCSAVSGGSGSIFKRSFSRAKPKAQSGGGPARRGPGLIPAYGLKLVFGLVN